MTKEYHSPARDDNERIERYQVVVTKATTDIWMHMMERLKDVPEELSKLSDKHIDILMDVEAVEAEWILEEDVRQSVSLIQYSSDEE